MKILVAGVAGASLGTEIIKSLRMNPEYHVYACDISSLAYGLHMDGVHGSFVVDRESYVESVVDICDRNDLRWIIPGGEQPAILLSASRGILSSRGIRLVANDPGVVTLVSDKRTAFEFLASRGVPIPKTYDVKVASDFAQVRFPCVIKPSIQTGGSDSVYLAGSVEEAASLFQLLVRGGRKPMVQEYIDAAGGEFTVGVLHSPSGELIGSIAMRRVFNSKLSISHQGPNGLISSGYSQGLIAPFPEICRQAEEIAHAVGSRGPLNIQGRIRDGLLVPFEINPRFSASTFLRALAGFNEVNLFLHAMRGGSLEPPGSLRQGYYMRSFTELFVPVQNVEGHEMVN